MDDAAHLPGVLLRKDRQHLVVRIPVVDDYGEVPPAGQADLFAEGGALGVPGRAVAMEIEPRFPDRHHLVAPGERLEAGEERVGESPRVVRVQTDDGVDPRVPMGDRYGPLAALRVDADRGDPGDPRVARPAHHFLLHVGKRRKVQVRVGVEKH